METQETTTTNVGLSTETPGTISPKPSPAEQPIKEWGAIISDFLAKLFVYIGEFFSKYEKQLVNALLFFLAIVAVRLVLAILAAINDFPLLSPLFELIGLGYTGWFVYRYLWKESNRQELKTEFNALKAQILGKNDIQA